MNKELTAVNAFIFAGSFSIGVMKAGFNLKKVLEIADNQPETNAFYFIKNYPNIPVILPSEWENDEYLNKLKNENIDLMCCNCPCSSLSTINRNASVEGKNNVHFYRLFNVFEKMQPKVFVIENAPTLIKLGFPILKDMVNKLNHLYNFTIIHDKAGNHNVAMQRMRTMVVGWRKDIFEKHPLINPNKQPQLTCKKLLEDIYNDTTNDHKSDYDKISELYYLGIPGKPIMTSICRHYLKMENGDNDELSNKIFNVINTNKEFLHEFNTINGKLKAGKNLWDKSPFKPYEDGIFPSFSSVQEYLHPKQNRTLNIKELQRLMNYPDDYDFTDPENKCKIPVCQAMAQGVPANFGKWIAEQVKLAFNNELKVIDNVEIVFQDHIKGKYKTFTIKHFNELEFLTINKDGINI